MFGQNPIRQFEDRDGGKTLQVHEVFYTLQGEGPFSGEPAVFVRLSGCNLACWFCDTQWDDARDPWFSVEEIERRIEAAAGKGWGGLIVLTGGEPLRQPLAKLFAHLGEVRPSWRVQIETAGTIWQDVVTTSGVTVVISPKTPKLAKQFSAPPVPFHPFFKYVIRADDPFDLTDGLPIARYQLRGNEERVAPLAKPLSWLGPRDVFLSPCDEYNEAKNERNRKEVARRALGYGYRAGLQLHKALELP